MHWIKVARIIKLKFNQKIINEHVLGIFFLYRSGCVSNNWKIRTKYSYICPRSSHIIELRQSMIIKPSGLGSLHLWDRWEWNVTRSIEINANNGTQINILFMRRSILDSFIVLVFVYLHNYNLSIVCKLFFIKNKKKMIIYLN